MAKALNHAWLKREELQENVFLMPGELGGDGAVHRLGEIQDMSKPADYGL